MSRPNVSMRWTTPVANELRMRPRLESSPPISTETRQLQRWLIRLEIGPAERERVRLVMRLEIGPAQRGRGESFIFTAVWVGKHAYVACTYIHY